MRRIRADRPPVDPRRARVPRRSPFLLAAFLCLGCAAWEKRTEGRPALAQRLLAAAAERAVAKIPLEPMRAARVVLRVVSPEKDTGPLLEAIVRDRLGREGVLLADSGPLELAVTFHAAGTDTEAVTYGVPVLSVLSGASASLGGFGDIAVFAYSIQSGYARLDARLVDRASGRTESSLGTFVGEASVLHFTFLIFFGPFGVHDLPDDPGG
ncbi:MAG: hypothetical protein L0323_10155 [Planctomycetes bacterium]|nr:hypothetical protein [Planctomycetota bacterium]